jgi:hypothetical protein
MIVERDKIRGCYHISTMFQGYLVTKVYYMYTRREAISRFRDYIRQLKENDAPTY